MNIRIGIIVPLFIYSFFSQAQQVAGRLEQIQVKKNNIKLKVQWVYSYSNGEPSESGYKNLVIEYDRDGHVLQETSYRSSGKVTYKRSYKYDGKGNVIQYQNFDGSRNKITYKRLSKYDHAGKKLKEIGFDGVDKFDNRYHYDNQGRLTQIEYYISNSLIEKRKISYSENKQVIVVYRPKDVIAEKNIKEFDDRGNVLLDVLYSPKGKELRKKTYIYNRNEEVIEEASYFSGNLKYKITNEYEDGRLVRIYREEPDNPRYMDYEYTYSKDGKLLSEKWYDKTSKKYSSKNYTYDSKGNFKEIDCYYALYDFRELFRMTFEYY